MSYYRAALAAARSGNLTFAVRLVKCSLILKENTTSAMHLYQLLRSRDTINKEALKKARSLVERQKYKKALRINLPKTTRGHTIRGLLYMQLGHYGSARKEFALALALDTGNELAKRAFFTTFHNPKAR